MIDMIAIPTNTKIVNKNILTRKKAIKIHSHELQARDFKDGRLNISFVQAMSIISSRQTKSILNRIMQKVGVTS
jgi:hypothetical protein